MLSYRHSSHAGNFADVIKHAVLVEILQYFTGKDEAFVYVDTHAGAGLYELESGDALKSQKYSNGIGRLKPEDWPELAAYFAIIQSYNTHGSLRVYPGSPVIAKSLLRSRDMAWLYELHPAECARLQNNIGRDRRIQIRCEDGFQGLKGMLKPLSGRGLVLIDPPYEMITDYAAVFETVSLAHAKFDNVSYAIWYPVVDRQHIVNVENRFIGSGIKSIQCYELGLTADARCGMTAAGMMVINPPPRLLKNMSRLLPRLADTLCEDDDACYRCDELVSA